MPTKLKPGDTVDYHAMLGGPVTSRNHIISAVKVAPPHLGGDVAWLSDRAGCVSCSALTLIKKAAPKPVKEQT